MSAILATHEAEIRRIMVQSQPGEIVCEILSQKNPFLKCAGGVPQDESPEFIPPPLYHKKGKKNGYVVGNLLNFFFLVGSKFSQHDLM
jgi:hypothetical protein